MDRVPRPASLPSWRVDSCKEPSSSSAIGRVTSSMLAAGEVKMAASEASDETVINEGRDAYA